MSLLSVWYQIVGQGKISWEIVEKHIAALTTGGPDIEPLIHVDLHRVFKVTVGDYRHDNPELYDFLMQLKLAGRKIVILTPPDFDDMVFSHLSAYFSTFGWGTADRLAAIHNMRERRDGDRPQAEMLISGFTHKPMRLDYKAHVSVVEPSILLPQSVTGQENPSSTPALT